MLKQLAFDTNFVSHITFLAQWAYAQVPYSNNLKSYLTLPFYDFLLVLTGVRTVQWEQIATANVLPFATALRTVSMMRQWKLGFHQLLCPQGGNTYGQPYQYLLILFSVYVLLKVPPTCAIQGSKCGRSQNCPLPTLSPRLPPYFCHLSFTLNVYESAFSSSVHLDKSVSLINRSKWDCHYA